MHGVSSQKTRGYELLSTDISYDIVVVYLYVKVALNTHSQNNFFYL
jgi:hypothetical protein